MIARHAAWVLLPLLAGCGQVGAKARDVAEIPRESLAGVAHADAKFVVSYGDRTFLADVTYIDLLDKSVIAVREREESPAERQPLKLRPRPRLPEGVPFSATAYGPVAVRIAERIAEVAQVCPGPPMRIDLKTDGTPRQLYRAEKRAWVVFAACPPPEPAEDLAEGS